MSVAAVLAPVFVQVALTFTLMWWMGATRTVSIRSRETRVQDVVLGQNNWPPRITQIGNAYHNQFQLPVLFYVLVILSYLTQKAGLLFVVLSWVFVLSRLVHAAIHTTSNNMLHRFAAFLVGAIVLLIMWIVFALRVLLGY